MLSYRILKAANRVRAANQDLIFPADLIEDDLRYDIGEFLEAELHADSQAQRADSERRTDDGDRAEQFLALVLRERTAQAFNRVFRRLGLPLCSAPDVFSVSGDTVRRYTGPRQCC